MIEIICLNIISIDPKKKLHPKGFKPASNYNVCL